MRVVGVRTTMELDVLDVLNKAYLENVRAKTLLTRLPIVDNVWQHFEGILDIELSLIEARSSNR